MRINQKTGMARVYDTEHVTKRDPVTGEPLEKGRWKWCHPVDAKEMIERGTASPDGPSDALVPKEAKPVKTADPEDDPDDEKGTTYDFSRHTMVELREFAEKAGIDGAETMKKPQLMERLSLAEFNPDATDEQEKNEETE